MLAPARHVDWDAVGHEVENNIIQALTADNDFMSEVNVSMPAGSSEWSEHWRFPTLLSVGF
jgi:hypothetical protein